jgi:hypothetical protein
MSKKILLFSVMLIGIGLLLAACSSATPAPTAEPTKPAQQPTKPPEPTAVPVSVEAPLVVPFEDVFKASGHADKTAEAFKHWDDADPKEVPTSCAKCHTAAGFVDFATNGKVTAAVPAPAGTFTCVMCHNAKAMALTSVTFPSGKVVNTSEEGEARCMTCHQGRESKVSVDKQIADFKVTDVDAVVAPIKDANGQDVAFGFRNVHYFAAGATLYGSQAQMGYEYDGKIYDPKFRHVEDMDTCIACHDQHATKVRIEKCAECHQGVTKVEDLQNVRMNGSLEDYNGNGDVKEGIAAELKGMQDILYGSIQAYANEVSKTPIVYDGTTYPYFFVAGADGKPAKDDKGNAVGYNKWTARLLKAAYNYQTSAKDPGAFAHNAKYIVELLYDSTEDLNAKLSKSADMSKLHRDDAAHFAGNTMPFRDWDDTGEVPAGCAKCHSAGGLPQFIHNGGTLAVTKSGVQITGVVGQPVANGFACTTCHDSAAGFPARYAVVNVPFPSGVSLTFSTEKDDQGNLKPVDANLCLECHQGRESTVTVNNALAAFTDADKADPTIRFRNIHYFAAGATLFGDDAKGAYEYDGQTYVGYNVTHPLNKCTDCHDVHALNVKVDACKGCHGDFKSLEDIRFASDTTDWNGNGDTKEGVSKEIDTFRTALYAAIQKYAETKAGTPIVYDAASYPYFFVDKNKDGKPDADDQGASIAYNAWTPRLLKAGFNYQYSIKDPGAFAHNPKFVLQFLYDSTKDLGGDVKSFTRP